MAAKPRTYDRLTNHGLSPEQAAIAAALQPLDKVASETEARWGIGVLERLVSPETAAKFASARVKLDNAIDAGDLDIVHRRASVMIRGWKAMEGEALKYRNKPGFDADKAWAATADDGTAYIITRTTEDSGHASKAHPDHRVWSLPEILRVLQSHELELVNKTKTLFPGATVVRAERKKVNMDEEIPF